MTFSVTMHQEWRLACKNLTYQNPVPAILKRFPNQRRSFGTQHIA